MPNILSLDELNVNGNPKLQAEEVPVIAKLDAEETDLGVIVGKINELVAVAAANGLSTQE